MSEAPIRLALADDQALVRGGLMALLSGFPRLQVVLEAGAGERDLRHHQQFVRSGFRDDEAGEEDAEPQQERTQMTDRGAVRPDRQLRDRCRGGRQHRRCCQDQHAKHRRKHRSLEVVPPVGVFRQAEHLGR